MGRKKKKVEQTNINKVDTISYQGSISVSVVNGNRLITKKKYHNKGMPNLFRFIANCLAGNKTESLRPTKIKLFNYKDAKDVLPNNFEWNTAWTTDTGPTVISPYIIYDATPVIEKDSKSDAYNVILHFRVPLSYIAGDEINVIGLYPSNATNDYGDISAYYLMADLDKNIWKPITIDTVSANYSLIMEWELSISNITRIVEVNNSENTEPSGE